MTSARALLLTALLGTALAATSARAQDADLDGVPDVADNCPAVANAGQENADEDQLGDACDSYAADPRNDSDGDGVPAEADACPGVANADAGDDDGDGVADGCDGCPTTFDPDQRDSNGDGINDACQCGDTNGDGDIDYEDAVAMHSCGVGATSCDHTIVDTDADGDLDIYDLVAYVDHLELWFFGYQAQYRTAGSFTCQRRPEPAVHRIPLTLGLGGGVVHGSALGAEGDVISLAGLPYAAPPAPDGSSRWRPPAAHPGFAGAHVDATANGPNGLVQTQFCPQRVFGKIVGKEDCVRLFVHAPRSLVDGAGRPVKRPVAVFVHGGAFLNQNSGMSFEELARDLDVVFVGLNYRLGVLGFVASPELQAESPNFAAGNYALQDLVLGLEWIQGNVHRFGGDPDNVTVFGNSAGGSLVSLLMATPEAEGLFRAVIATSGGLAAGPLPELPTSPGGPIVTSPILRHPFERAADITARAGCTGGGSFPSELACLRAASPAALVAAAEGQTHRVLPDAGFAEFFPVVDHHVLPVQPADALAAGASSDVLLVIGATADEGTSFNSLSQLGIFQWWDRLMVIAGGNAALAQSLHLVYFPTGVSNPPFANSDLGRKRAYDALTGELTFICPSLRFARAAALAPGRTAPVHAFLHSHVMRNAQGAPLLGALHNHAIAYMLGGIDETFSGFWGALLAGGPVALTPTDHLLEESMHHAFRRTVRDAIADLPASQPTWPAFTALNLEDEDVMVFDGYASGLPPGVASRTEAAVRDGRCDALVGLGLVR